LAGGGGIVEDVDEGCELFVDDRESGPRGVRIADDVVNIYYYNDMEGEKIKD